MLDCGILHALTIFLHSFNNNFKLFILNVAQLSTLKYIRLWSSICSSQFFPFGQ